MKRDLLNAVLLFVIGVVSATGAIGQGLPDPQQTSDLKGKVRAVSYERTTLVSRGKSIPPTNERLFTELYDTQGRLIQTSVFGNAEKRTSVDYSVTPAKISVSYFDLEGRPTTISFVPNANEISDARLCPRYSIREEKDAAAKIERTVEVCEDGSTRATNLSELDEKGRVFRWVRTDAVRRSWEARFRHDEKSGDPLEYIFGVDDLERPKYWQTINYADYRYDARGNWVQIMASSFDSRAPNQLVYQMIEKRNIEYYPD